MFFCSHSYMWWSPPCPLPFPKSSIIKQVYKFVQFLVYTTEASVKICTFSSWSKLNKFVHLGLSVQICTLGVSVQICALLDGREVYKYVHSWLGERCTNLYTNASFHSDIHEIVTNCVKYYPNSKNYACMLNYNLILVKVCILLKSLTELSY